MANEGLVVDAVSPLTEHCREALRKFVMNAVVIDNEPVLNDHYKNDKAIPKTATIIEEGFGAAEEEVEANPVDDSIAEANDSKDDNQKLNIRRLSDAFAKEEIACAFVLPDDDDQDRESVLKRVTTAAAQADIVIIDWYLQDKDPTLTMDALKHIAEQDVADKGRLRLVCIYTGQPDTRNVLEQAIKIFTDANLATNLPEGETETATGKHHRLIVLNKNSVSCDELPEKILQNYAKLAEGLLPAFALSAVAAIRKNTHHIITRFSKDMDAAYVSNRLLTDPPEDVAKMMRELFVSECDTALGLERVADKCLGKAQIMDWLDHEEQPKDNTAIYKGAKKIDRPFINSMVNNGLVNDCVNHEDQPCKFPADKRAGLSRALYGSNGESNNAEKIFARHVILKREAFGATKLISDENWTPSLTLGTILRQELETGGNTHYSYFYCLTPACDTIRVRGEKRSFLMLEIKENDKGRSNLVVMEEKKEKKLFIDPHPQNVKSFLFSGTPEVERVMAEKNDTGEFNFTTACDNHSKLLWLGEVRQNRATRDMADLNRNWLRFGINDSEFLRLVGEGKFKFD